jgi:hypothetical protein
MYMTANVEVKVPMGHYTIGEVAALCDTTRSRVNQLFVSRKLPEPPRIGPTNYRAIPRSWLPRIADLLANQKAGRPKTAQQQFDAALTSALVVE